MVDELGWELSTAPTMNQWWFMAKKANTMGLPVPNTATVDADFELMQPGNPALNQPVAELRA
jgi:hypothetical protein